MSREDRGVPFERRPAELTLRRLRTGVIFGGVHVRQHFKGRPKVGMETSTSYPGDFGVDRDLSKLSCPQRSGREANRCSPDVRRLSEHCGLSGEDIELVVTATVAECGHPAPDLQSASGRLMAACVAFFGHVANGVRNAQLLRRVKDLIEAECAAAMVAHTVRSLLRKATICHLAHMNRVLFARNVLHRIWPTRPDVLHMGSYFGAVFLGSRS